MQKRQRLLARGIYNVFLSNPITWHCCCALPHRDRVPPVTAGGRLGPVLCCKLLTFFHHMNNTRVSMVCHTRSSHRGTVGSCHLVTINGHLCGYTNTALCPLALVKSTVRIKFSSKMLFVFVFVSPPTGRTGCRWRHYLRVTRPAVSYALFYIY